MPPLRTPLAALLLLACCAAPKTAGFDRDSRPNLILIVSDDQGFGELSAAGHPWIRTPALDDMARSGLALERFYAAAPVCSPTRASLLTGRHPCRTGTLAWGHDLPAHERTFAEALRERGYATGHFGKWHLGSVRAGAPTSPGAQGFERWASTPNFFDLDPALSVEGEVVAHGGEGSDVVTERALAFLREATSAGRPFALVLWFGSPHVPHDATDADLAAEAHAPEALRAYCAEFSAIDRNLARVRAELRRLAIAQRTLLWYTSDNGPRAPGAAAQHATGGLRGDKGTLWEGGVRVPSLLEWPGVIAAGSASDAPAGSVDVFPTFLELAGATPGPVHLDGSSLTALFSGAPLERDGGLGFWTPPARGRAQHADRILAEQAAGRVCPEETPPVLDLTPFEAGALPGHAAWIDGPWKLHALPTEEGMRFELYDLVQDPAESRDLAPGRPGLTERMRSELEAWQRDAVAELVARRM